MSKTKKWNIWYGTKWMGEVRAATEDDAWTRAYRKFGATDSHVTCRVI